MRGGNSERRAGVAFCPRGGAAAVRLAGSGLVAALALAMSSSSCAAGPAPQAGPVGPARADARPASTLVPGTQLTGAGAFEGPVRQVPVNGIKIGYRQFGNGPDLIMVMGDSTAMSLWTVDLLTRLARSFRVTIFDNRGVGYSADNPAQKMTIPLLADDTAGLIRALGLGAPTLLGWSMGAEIGLTVAALHPGVLGRLVTSGGDAGSAHAVQATPNVQRELSDPATTPARVLDLLFPASAAAAKQAFVAQYLLVPQQAASPEVLRAQYAAESAFAADSGTWDALPGISIPVLVSQGSEDVVVPPVNADRLARRIPNATLTVVDGAGHGMLFQDSARCADMVTAWVGSGVGPGVGPGVSPGTGRPG